MSITPKSLNNPLMKGQVNSTPVESQEIQQNKSLFKRIFCCWSSSIVDPANHANLSSRRVTVVTRSTISVEQRYHYNDNFGLDNDHYSEYNDHAKKIMDDPKNRPLSGLELQNTFNKKSS